MRKGKVHKGGAVRLVAVGILFISLTLASCSLSPEPQNAEPETETHGPAGPDRTGPGQSSEGPITITWWSHWANEPAKRAVIEKIAADYEAEKPGVDIAITWWDKNPLREAVRGAMISGSGAPDIATFETSQVEWAEAGWLIDLNDVLPWDHFVSAARDDGVFEGTDGIYKLNIGFKVDMLLFNPEIFEELGIQVPDDFQFTQDEFVEVVKRCRAAGYAGIANAIGDRSYPGRFPAENALVNLVGIEEFGTYYRGEIPWDTPQARQVLKWMATLTDEGLYPESLDKMGIDEYHAFFHTLQRACMVYSSTTYTGRAFKAEAEGGQPASFRFGMLRYPEMDGAQGQGVLRGGFEPGYAVLSLTEHPEVAKDILAFAAQPKYGALWVALTNSPSAILYDQISDWPTDALASSFGFEPGEWDWYWDEFNKVYGPMEVGVTNEGRCAQFEEASIQALNEGIPRGLLTVDEAISLLDANLCR
jgi:ABC-type glycerol-3-phosphate transport system substrate-binding protein